MPDTGEIFLSALWSGFAFALLFFLLGYSFGAPMRWLREWL